MQHCLLVSGGYDSTVLRKLLEQEHPNLLTYHVPIETPWSDNFHEEKYAKAEIVSNPLHLGLPDPIDDYIPFRNSLLVLECANFLRCLGGEWTIYIGIIKNDPAHPDCSNKWVESMNTLLEVEGAGIKLEAPFVDMHKGQVYKVGTLLGVDIDNTFSCNFASEGQACGHCNNCKWREGKK